MVQKTITLVTLLGFLLSSQGLAFALSPLKSTSVALIPYAEEPSEELNQIVKEVGERLEKGRGIRVLEQEKTNAILDYYLNYVAQESSEQEIDQLLTEARERLLVGDYTAAATLLQRAENKIEQGIANNKGNDGLYQIHLLKAKIYHAQGATKDVEKEYDKIVLLNPDLQLDPGLYPRWERETLEASRQKIASERKGFIQVLSEPEGSEVLLNGIAQGITPLMIEKLPPATHCIEVKTVHHNPYFQCFHLGAGEKVSLHPQLNRIDFAVLQEKTRTIQPSQYQSDIERSKMVSSLGYHLGVDKVILVSQSEDRMGKTVTYRVGTSELGALQPAHKMMMGLNEPEHNFNLLSNELQGDIRADVLTNPDKYANRTVGSLALHEKKEEPIYKKPLFWILMGAGAAALSSGLGAGLGGQDAKTGSIAIEL